MVSGPLPALLHTQSPVGRGSGSSAMSQGWLHCGYFFYFYNLPKWTCFIFKHHLSLHYRILLKGAERLSKLGDLQTTLLITLEKGRGVILGREREILWEEDQSSIWLRSTQSL